MYHCQRASRATTLGLRGGRIIVPREVLQEAEKLSIELQKCNVRYRFPRDLSLLTRDLGAHPDNMAVHCKHVLLNLCVRM